TEDFAAVMMLRVQHERMHESFFPNAREYARLWGLSAARLETLPAETFIMHPGPMNRGFEMYDGAADSPRALVLDQVENGVSVRMAVLDRLLTAQQQTNNSLPHPRSRCARTRRRRHRHPPRPHRRPRTPRRRRDRGRRRSRARGAAGT